MARFGRRRGFSKNLRPVDSNKNSVIGTASTGTTTQSLLIAKAKDFAVNTVTTEVERGCTINNIWLSLDFCGLAATGVLQNTDVFIMKNPGDNLTAPAPSAVGSSNEKKFVFKEWRHMTMRNQDGNPPYHWEGWIPVPRVYRRMGADDTINLVHAVSSAAGHIAFKAIYKWYK